jgi:hypothetical protein
MCAFDVRSLSQDWHVHSIQSSCWMVQMRQCSTGRNKWELTTEAIRAYVSSSKYFVLTRETRRSLLSCGNATPGGLLLANPEQFDPATFNREVWRHNSSITLNGKAIGNLESLATGPRKRSWADIEQAIEAGGLKWHGNSVWEPGSRVVQGYRSRMLNFRWV